MGLPDRSPKRHLPVALERHLSLQPRTKEIMLPTGKDVIDTKVRLIGEAKYSIDMQYYSFEADETGRRILDACKDAKAINPQLKIRVLVDNSVEYLHNGEIVGTSEEARKKRDETNELLMQLRDEGVLDIVAVTNRFNLKRKWANRLHLYSNILHRDHKKYFLVDTRDIDQHPDAVPKAIVGSANINHFHEKEWKDAGRLFEGGEIVRTLAEDFEYTAHHAQNWERIYAVQSPREYFQKYGLLNILSHPRRSLSDLRGAVVRNAERKGKRVVTTPDPSRRKERDEVVATDSFFPSWFFGLGRRAATKESVLLLKKAKPGEMVSVATPYPGFLSFTRNLVHASKRGVDVRLIIPKENNHVLYNHKKIDEFVFPEKVPPWLQHVLRRASHANLTHWEKKLTKGGVSIYKYTGANEGLAGMLHFKGMQLRRLDSTSRSINGSLNYSKGVISGMNREVIVATEGTIDTDPMVPFMDELMADAELIPPAKSYRRRTKSA